MMDTFDRKRFYALGKKTLIWGVFFLSLYVLRDLFALIFFTFILAFITFRLSSYAVNHLGASRRFSITVIYLLLLLAILWLGYILVPRVFNEARQFVRDLPQVETKITDTMNNLRQRYTELSPVLDPYADPEWIAKSLSGYTEDIGRALPHVIALFLNGLMTVVLSIVFSFLIVLDLARVSRDLMRLRDTRLHDFFQETALPIVTFGGIVGKAFEAQTLIALVNTVLTVIGMTILGIPKVALLGIIVFLCSFVPVLGVLISSVPVVLVSFNAAGFWLSFVALVMIVLVHALEAYVINPRVYARHMKMNPVFVLIVLFLGHHLFGIWGVLLAVPVTHYFITHVAGLRSAGHEAPRKPGSEVWRKEEMAPEGAATPAPRESEASGTRGPGR